MSDSMICLPVMAIPHFIQRLQNVAWGRIFSDLTTGLGVSCAVFVLTVLFSLPLGMLVCQLRRSKILLLSWATKIYISIMRGTPLMLQIMVVYFGPYYMFGISLRSEYRFIAVILAFSINYAAYFAEIFRGGIESIPIGQSEAAHVLGYSRWQTFYKIILPQVIKRVLPPVTNEVITLVKDTSLAMTVSLLEMFTMAKQLSSSMTSMMPLVVAGVFYYILNYVVAFLMEQLEKKMNYYR